jgi:hypothetical protein
MTEQQVPVQLAWATATVEIRELAGALEDRLERLCEQFPCPRLNLALRETRLWHKHLLRMTCVPPLRRGLERN